MRYIALATDYDGTLAHDGAADDKTLRALERLRESGRKLILVTGRELPDLESVFPHLDLFDRVVAENGALLFNPANRDRRVVAERPPDHFIEELKRRGVEEMSVGEAIVATWRPYETTVLETIRDLGLQLQVIFNKDAVMVLPASTNKMTGLKQALDELQLSRRNVAGIGDAENDHAFLGCCECAAAVANAIPALKDRVDLVTAGDHGAGVSEFIERIIEDDLRSVELPIEKHGVTFGRKDGRDIFIGAYGQALLLCGQSGGGKTDFVTGAVERLTEKDYQLCIIDPEGDYEKMPGFLTVGREDHAPAYESIMEHLSNPAANVTVNLIGVKVEDRPAYFASLIGRLEELRMRHGRPHWVIVDEAHQLMPADWGHGSAQAARQTASLLLATVHPGRVSPEMLRQVNILGVIGKEPHKMAEEFARAVKIEPPAIPPEDLEKGKLSVWFRDSNRVIAGMEAIRGKTDRERRRRKYMQGELEPQLVFYFRGRESKLNLKAQNLKIFMQKAAGVDDDTWLFHLRKGDYSDWVNRAMRNDDLAETIRAVEQDQSLDAKASREKIAKAIEAEYAPPE